MRFHCTNGLVVLRIFAVAHLRANTVSGDPGWQVRDVNVEEKGCQDRSLWNAVLMAL